jgi:hypothetical protein
MAQSKTACKQYCLAVGATQGYDRLHANRQALKKHLPSFMLSNSTILKTNFCFLFAF